MVDESGYDLKDYKFFCFNGEVRMLMVAADRGDELKRNFYDVEFNSLKIMENELSNKICKPDNYEKMVDIAEKLASDLPHVRVDLYNVKGKIYFGEMTLYHKSGHEHWKPKEYDKILGKWFI